MADSFEIAWSAHEKIAPPEALWSRSSTKIAVNAHHSRRRPRGLLIVDAEARSNCRRPLYYAAASIPAQIPWRARDGRRGGTRKLWLGLAGRASPDTPAAWHGRRGPQDAPAACRRRCGPQDALAACRGPAAPPRTQKNYQHPPQARAHTRQRADRALP